MFINGIKHIKIFPERFFRFIQLLNVRNEFAEFGAEFKTFGHFLYPVSYCQQPGQAIETAVYFCTAKCFGVMS